MTPEVAALLASYEVISDTQIAHRGEGGIRIGRVVRARMAGQVRDVRYWYVWSGDCPLHHIDSVPVE